MKHLNEVQREYVEARVIYYKTVATVDERVNDKMNEINKDHSKISLDTETAIEAEAWKYCGLSESADCLTECRENLLRWGMPELKKVANSNQLAWLEEIEKSKSVILRDKVIGMLLKLYTPRA